MPGFDQSPDWQAGGDPMQSLSTKTSKIIASLSSDAVYRYQNLPPQAASVTCSKWQPEPAKPNLRRHYKAIHKTGNTRRVLFLDRIELRPNKKLSSRP